MDTNQSLYDSYAPSFSPAATNLSSQVPELTRVFNRIQNNLSLGSTPLISRNLTVENNIDARWASPDGDNSEPRIITEPLRSFTHQIGGQNAMQRTDIRNGMVMTGLPMEQLTLECDPHAWDLQPDELDYQRLIGNICKYLPHLFLKPGDVFSSSLTLLHSNTNCFGHKFAFNNVLREQISPTHSSKHVRQQ